MNVERKDILELRQQGLSWAAIANRLEIGRTTARNVALRGLGIGLKPPAGHRQTQCDRILAVLQAHEGEWVPLPRILALGIAQYNARIFELRTKGYDIQNWPERAGDGQVHSWYRLVPKAEQLELLRTA